MFFLDESSLVSFIVPVYNVQQYLEKCLKSIEKQIYKNFEVLLIDDGSVDDSLMICKFYEKKDNRFRVISQKNQGLSVARNTGIQNAKGDYYVFVDSDDYVSPYLIDFCLKKLLSFDADLVVYGFHIMKDGIEIKNDFEDPELGITVSNNALKGLFGGKYGNYICKLFIKKEIFLDNNIEFPVGKKFEDISTMYKIYGLSKRIYISSKRLYFYVQRENSITHTHDKKDLASMMDTFQQMDEFIMHYYPELVNELYEFQFNLLCMLLIRMKRWNQGLRYVVKRKNKDERIYTTQVIEQLKGIYNKCDTRTWKLQLKMLCINLKIFPIVVMLHHNN